MPPGSRPRNAAMSPTTISYAAACPDTALTSTTSPAPATRRGRRCRRPNTTTTVNHGRLAASGSKSDRVERELLLREQRATQPGEHRTDGEDQHLQTCACRPPTDRAPSSLSRIATSARPQRAGPQVVHDEERDREHRELEEVERAVAVQRQPEQRRAVHGDAIGEVRLREHEPADERADRERPSNARNNPRRRIAG